MPTDVDSPVLPPISSLLLSLPASLLSSILCFLPLHDKLDHCSRLSKHFPPLTSAAFRSDPLLITTLTVPQLTRSSRLLALFAQLSNVTVDTASPLEAASSGVHPPESTHPLRELHELSAGVLQSLRHLSALRRLSIKLHSGEQTHSVDALLTSSLSLASRSSLTSLSLTVVRSETLPFDLSSCLAPLSAMRHLHLGVSLHPDCMNLLLQRPLHILDLSASHLSQHPIPALPTAGSWTFASTCRVLRLPQSRHLISDTYLDALVEQWPSEVAAAGRSMGTLEVNHVMSHSAATAILDTPSPTAPHTLGIAIRLHKVHLDQFVSLALSLPQLAPTNLHLSLAYLHNTDGLVQCVDLLTRHSGRVRSFAVHSVPFQVAVKSGRVLANGGPVRRLLAAASHCTRLQSIALYCEGSSMNDRRAGIDLAALEQPGRWAERLMLPQLRSLSLAHVNEDDLCRVLVASPSLHRCSLFLHSAQHHRVLGLLSTGCRHLGTLQLHSNSQPINSRTAAADDIATHPPRLVPFPFHSLTSLTLQGSTWWDGRVVEAAADVGTLASKPFHYTCPPQPYTPTNITSLAAWDNELDEEEREEEKESLERHSITRTATHSTIDSKDDTPPPLTPFQPPLRNSTDRLSDLSAMMSASSSESNHHPAVPPFSSHLLCLLARTPHLVSLSLTVYPGRDAALAHTLLHILGLLGVHTPLLETLQFAFKPTSGPIVNAHSCLPMNQPAVELLAAAYRLPAAPFARLRSVTQSLDGTKGQPVQVAPALTWDALRWLQREWFISSPLGEMALPKLFMETVLIKLPPVKFGSFSLA